MARSGRLKGANYLGNDDHMVDYSWVAVAFSADQRLGRDLVFPCTNAPDGKNVRIYLVVGYVSFSWFDDIFEFWTFEAVFLSVFTFHTKGTQ